MTLKLLTAVAALLASVSAFAGELDGKGVICLGTAEGEWNQTWEATVIGVSNWYSAYLFDGGSYRIHGLKRDGTTLKIVPSEYTPSYSASAGEVHLAYGETLDRRTLKMTRDSSEWVKQCEAYADVESLEAAFEEIRRAESEALKAYMSKNKI